MEETKLTNESIKSTIANPAPLGLFAFGVTTVLLNLHNADIISAINCNCCNGFRFGGAAQIIAGIMEYKKNNVFGATAFTTYGFFWWSLIIIGSIHLMELQLQMTRAWGSIFCFGLSLH